MRALNMPDRLAGMFLPERLTTPPVPERRRAPVDHVVILDGTMSSLEPHCISNAGQTCRLLTERLPSARLSLFYESGIQWERWHKAGDVITGQGVNEQIRRAYGFIASRYRPGDRIFLLGYSRGAYGVRSLAGMIDRVGLLRHDAATERNTAQAWRHYSNARPDDGVLRAWCAARCHPETNIELVGVWDTVKAMGIRLPLLSRYSEPAHAFHNHHLGPHIRHGFQALALDETRAAFAPILWDSPDHGDIRLEQLWFRGCHGDVGGQLFGYEPARPLANIPLVWILERAEGCGLALPAGWRARFAQDPDAPSLGTWRRWGKLFLARRRRVMGCDQSEAVHPSARAHLPRAPVIRAPEGCAEAGSTGLPPSGGDTPTP